MVKRILASLKKMISPKKAVKKGAVRKSSAKQSVKKSGKTKAKKKNVCEFC